MYRKGKATDGGDMAGAAREFADLAKNLRAVGDNDLRKELFQSIDEAAAPVAAAIGSGTNLRDKMPDRYADVLSHDLKISTHKTTGGAGPGGDDPGQRAHRRPRRPEGAAAQRRGDHAPGVRRPAATGRCRRPG